MLSVAKDQLTTRRDMQSKKKKKIIITIFNIQIFLPDEEAGKKKNEFHLQPNSTKLKSADVQKKKLQIEKVVWGGETRVVEKGGKLKKQKVGEAMATCFVINSGRLIPNRKTDFAW